MNKKFLAKIIAKDSYGLQTISACCSGAKVNISNIKYLPKNKIFLMFFDRYNKENNSEKTISSICKFEFIDKVKSFKIDQKDLDLKLELLTIDLLKNDKNYEINLFFSNNEHIMLSTEIIEVTLEDQNQTIK